MSPHTPSMLMLDTTMQVLAVTLLQHAPADSVRNILPQGVEVHHIVFRQAWWWTSSCWCYRWYLARHVVWRRHRCLDSWPRSLSSPPVGLRYWAFCWLDTGWALSGCFQLDDVHSIGEDLGGQDTNMCKWIDLDLPKPVPGTPDITRTNPGSILAGPAVTVVHSVKNSPRLSKQ